MVLCRAPGLKITGRVKGARGRSQEVLVFPFQNGVKRRYHRWKVIVTSVAYRIASQKGRNPIKTDAHKYPNIWIILNNL